MSSLSKEISPVWACPRWMLALRRQGQEDCGEASLHHISIKQQQQTRQKIPECLQEITKGGGNFNNSLFLCVYMFWLHIYLYAMCMWYPRRPERDIIHHYTRSEVEFKASKMLSWWPVALVVEGRTDGTVFLSLTYMELRTICRTWFPFHSKVNSAKRDFQEPNAIAVVWASFSLISILVMKNIQRRDWVPILSLLGQSLPASHLYTAILGPTQRPPLPRPFLVLNSGISFYIFWVCSAKAHPFFWFPPMIQHLGMYTSAN